MGVYARLGRLTVSAACGTNIAANFTLNNPSLLDVTKNADGTVNVVTVYGGGWGHNEGMSQYGAHAAASLVRSSSRF
jgi:peptidoglycan hydrolase-like amidase